MRKFGTYESIRDHFPKYVVFLDEFDIAGTESGIKIFKIFLPAQSGTKHSQQMPLTIR